MTSVGETLRRERIRRNLDIDSIARETRISSRFLAAIEDEQFDKLPGGVFTRSFVRQYARLLELDEEELVAALDEVLAPPDLGQGEPAAPERHEPVEARIPLPKVEDWQSAGDRRFNLSSVLPAAAGVIVVMLVCSLIYGWWQRSRQVQPAELPRTAVTNAAPPAPPPQAQAQPPEQPQPAPSVPAEAPAPQPQTAPAQPQVTPTAAEPATKAPAGSVPPSPPSKPGATVHVQITALEPTWVLVRADGKYLFSGTLDINESRTVEGNESVLVRLGNAGGVTVTHNGKSLGVPGPKGQVRTLQFTSGGFQALGAPPAAPKPAPATDPL